MSYPYNKNEQLKSSLRLSLGIYLWYKYKYISLKACRTGQKKTQEKKNNNFTQVTCLTTVLWVISDSIYLFTRAWLISYCYIGHSYNMELEQVQRRQQRWTGLEIKSFKSNFRRLRKDTIQTSEWKSWPYFRF